VVVTSCAACREAPGLDKFRPDQQTPVPNFYLAGSYTAQDYIDSMEGATLSGRQAAYKILENVPSIMKAQPKTQAQMV
jgi:zeta-carotene desaturase